MRVARLAALAPACILVGGCNGDLLTPVAGPLVPTQPQRAVAAAGQSGAWSAPITWPVIAAHMTVLPDGRFLAWTSNDQDHAFHTPNVYLWDAASPSLFTQVPNAFTDVFCAAHSFMPDGKLLIAGGHITDNVGVKDANLFNWQSGTWSRVASMRAGRWYPTTAVTGSGEIAVVAGADEHHHSNPFPEVWDGTKFRLLGGAPLDMPFYPWLNLAPDGRLFNSGPEKQTRYLNPSGDGEWVDASQTVSGVFREYGTAVVYAPGKILIVGGGDPPVKSAEVVDLNVSPAFTSTGPMQYARRQLNATVLPDGKVLVIGGTSAPGFNDEAGAVLVPEMWDPATGTWTALAPMTVPRAYHSTAVLMPDGRVLAAGGGRCGTCYVQHEDAEIFSPPYLFKADGSPAVRPTITSAPTTISRGQTFTVGTPDAAGITHATMIRLPSITHAYSMNQAFVSLPATQTSGGVLLAAPPNPNLVPAGHYMLFLLNAAGVPSVSKVVQLLGNAAAPAPPPAPAPPSYLSASQGSATQINLKWADNSNAESSFRIESCQGSGCTNFAEIAFVAANATTFAHTGTTTGTAYSYRVRAMNAAGASGYSNTATISPSTVTMTTLTNRLAAKCMEVPGVSHNNLVQLVLWDCHGGENQVWTALPVGTTGPLKVYGYKCVDGFGAEGGGKNGDLIVTYDCHGGTNQQWTRTPAGEIRNFTGAMCIDVSGKATANGSKLVLWTCDGSASQKWDAQGSTTPPPNQAPAANFTSACSGLTCSFTNTSTDGDGTIVSSSWAFGNGATSTATSPSYTYAAGGTYSVTLTVTDDDGATNGTTKSVTVTAPPASAPIALTATGSKVKGVQRVDLSWTGATTDTVHVYRDGALIAKPANNVTTKSGSYVDNLNRKGSATYQYKVCEKTGTTVCSANKTVVF